MGSTKNFSQRDFFTTCYAQIFADLKQNNVDFAVLSLYEKQRELIQKDLSDTLGANNEVIVFFIFTSDFYCNEPILNSGIFYFPQVIVVNVDAFQGREVDFIILNLVRSNSKKTMGFVADTNRLNVAISRAKYGLLILGNFSRFENFKNQGWSSFVEQLKKLAVFIHE